MAAFGLTALILPVQADNTVGTRWRTPGSKPPGSPVLQWGSLSVLAGLIANRTTGSGAFSHNVRQYLTGTGAATATISVVFVSGSSVSQWSVSGDNLQNAGNTAGTGFLILRATSAGNSLDSSSLGWAYFAAATDTQKPARVTGITITPAVNALAFTFDPSADSAPAGVNPSGLKDYRIYKNGVLAATVNAPSPGIMSTLSTTTVGSYSPTPAFGFSASNDGEWSLTSAGSGIHNTITEQMLFRGQQVSGDFDMSAQVVQFNAVGSYQFSTAGLMAHETLAQGAPFMAVYQEPTDVAPRVQTKRRAVAGSNSANRSANSLTAGQLAWLRLTRTGNTFRSFYSLDGVVWIQQIEEIITMATTVNVGLFCTSQSVGNAVTAIFRNFKISNSPQVSYTLSPASGTANYTISARDVSLNESAVSPAVSATPLAGPAVQPIRYNPGHYVTHDGVMRNDNASAYVTAAINTINAANVGDNPHIKGVKLFIQWGAVQPGTVEPGNTAQFLANLRAIRDAAAAKGKQIWLSFLHVVFGGTGSDLTPYFPSWVINGSNYGITIMTNGKTSRTWQSNTMTAIINQTLAVINADNGHGVAFKDDPYLEAVQIDETAVGVSSGTDLYTPQALLAQYKRWITAVRAAAPNMGIRVTTNYLGADDNMAELIAHAAANDCIIGGPDVLLNDGIQADRIFSGTPPTGSQSQTLPVVDYRGVIPRASEVQSPSMHGHEGDWSAAQLYNFARDGGTLSNGVVARGQRPNYMIWVKKEWEQRVNDPPGNPSGGIKYSTTRLGDGSPSIKTFIDSINGVVPTTDYPDGYPQ